MLQLSCLHMRENGPYSLIFAYKCSHSARKAHMQNSHWIHKICTVACLVLNHHQIIFISSEMLTVTQIYLKIYLCGHPVITVTLNNFFLKPFNFVLFSLQYVHFFFMICLNRVCCLSPLQPLNISCDWLHAQLNHSLTCVGCHDCCQKPTGVNAVLVSAQKVVKIIPS